MKVDLDRKGLGEVDLLIKRDLFTTEEYFRRAVHLH